MSLLLPHKQALYEIFQAEIDDSTDGLLYEKCDGILYTSVDKLPRDNKWTKFLVLGDYEARDIAMGWNPERCRMYTQAIHVICLVTGKILESEAEYYADEIGRIVRNILKNNQDLVSTTYTTGIAIESHLWDSKSEFTQFWELRANMQTITLQLKVKEA